MRAILAAACIAALTACGGRSTLPLAGAEHEWIANTGGVIDELERDVLLAGSGGDTIRAARQALDDQSNLYTILVAYTDFGGCNHMVSAAGTPAERFARVERILTTACTLLQRAAVLFTRAVTRHEPSALLAATRTTLRASPLLTHAKIELDRLAGG
jgi:hypothetical protein